MFGHDYQAKVLFDSSAFTLCGDDDDRDDDLDSRQDKLLVMSTSASHPLCCHLVSTVRFSVFKVSKTIC